MTLRDARFRNRQDFDPDPAERLVLKFLLKKNKEIKFVFISLSHVRLSGDVFLCTGTWSSKA